ncbi:MAG: glycerate kinase [Planctomycetota bacterium]
MANFAQLQDVEFPPSKEPCVMRVLIIPDKFKGSLTAHEVSAAVERGLKQAHPNLITQTVIASDGGDGFLEAAKQNVAGVETVRCATFDPLGREISGEYLYDVESKTAFVEMAQASGLVLLTPEERNPMRTSTYGTGVLIADALGRGAARVYIGLGGSATNDGGLGIATALGYRFLDRRGEELTPVGQSLGAIESIDATKVLAELAKADLFAINDVINPLLGAEGAAHVYGPQKGADAVAVQELDAGLNHLDRVVQKQLNKDAAEMPGAGAAGGTGFGLHVFAGASFVSGIEFILKLAGVEKLLSKRDIDWIVTGEGKIDDQTAYGKLVRGVSQIGARYEIPVVAVCGILELNQQTVAGLGLRHVAEIHDRARPLQFTIDHAAELVEATAKTILSIH